ncbi:MAG: hypothetical protein M1281_16800, partial [Chloroflexi bacterium]|nr:hypothetical protein [Chloroflexota bacterium]
MVSFPWRATYDKDAYLGWLNTHSSHLVLPEKTRRRLFAEIGRVIEARGGYLEMHFVSVVYMAKKDDS